MRIIRAEVAFSPTHTHTHTHIYIYMTHTTCIHINNDPATYLGQQRFARPRGAVKQDARAALHAGGEHLMGVGVVWCGVVRVEVSADRRAQGQTHAGTHPLPPAPQNTTLHYPPRRISLQTCYLGVLERQLDHVQNLRSHVRQPPNVRPPHVGDLFIPIGVR